MRRLLGFIHIEKQSEDQQGANQRSEILCGEEGGSSAKILSAA